MGIATTCLGCGTVIRSGSYCDNCKTPRERASRQQRGYGTDWERKRPRILKRDNYECQIKLLGCTDIATQVDHIIPKEQGGSDDDWNLQAACRHCNSSKKDKLLTDTR